MRKTYKRWLAAVLCLVCMWAMAPAGAGAEEEAYYPFALPGVLEVVQLNNVPPTAQVITLWEDFNRSATPMSGAKTWSFPPTAWERIPLP